MKEKLQCDNCGGNLIHKEEDIFVCEHCGTGYRIGESKPAPYRNPQLDNTIIVEGLNPNKMETLCAEWASFTANNYGRLL